MDFLVMLNQLMKEKGLNKSTLSQLSGVPYTTIDGFYKKGYENAKISTVRKIASALDVSLDYLVGAESAPAQGGAPQVYNDISSEALLIARAYDLADVRTRQIVSLSLSGEIERVKKAIHKTEAM